MPPFVAVAMNVTKFPAQTGLDEGAIEMLTGSSGLTVMFKVFDAAGLFTVY